MADAQGPFNRLCNARPVIRADRQPVNDNFDVVAPVLFESKIIAKLHDLPIDASADIPRADQIIEKIAEFTLLTAGNRCKDQSASLRRKSRNNSGNDLLAGLRRDRSAALRAMLRTNAGVQDAQKIMNRGDRADRRTRIPPGGLLL